MPRLCMLGQVCRRGWPSSVQHAEKYERGKISMYNNKKGQIPLTSKKNANLGGRGPQRIMAQLENGFPREYGLKLALVRLLEMENGFKQQQE